MAYRDLRDFAAQLESLGELRRVGAEVDPHLEMTEVCDRVLRAGRWWWEGRDTKECGLHEQNIKH